MLQGVSTRARRRPLPLLPPSSQDEVTSTPQFVCIRNCTCPADGGACTLGSSCGVKIDVGGGRRGVGGGALFFWLLVALVLGGGGALGYIHWYGVPAWLPIRERGYGGLGMYNELSEHGI